MSLYQIMVIMTIITIVTIMTSMIIMKIIIIMIHPSSPVIVPSKKGLANIGLPKQGCS